MTCDYHSIETAQPGSNTSRATLKHLWKCLSELTLIVERFTIECPKIKTKVITAANQKKRVSITRSQSVLKVNTCNRPEARENAGDQVARLVLVLNLIG